MRSARARWALAGGIVLVAIMVGTASVTLYHRRQSEVMRQEAERSARNQEEEQAARESTLMARAEQERRNREEQAHFVDEERRREEEQEAHLQQEEGRRAVARRQEIQERRRQADEAARRQDERRLADERARADEEQRAEGERREEESRRAEERAAARQAEEQAAREEAAQQEAAAEAAAVAAAASIPEEDDDTPEVETENTIDAAVDRRGWSVEGDLRPITDYNAIDARDGDRFTEARLGFRFRLDALWGVTKQLRLGARLAGICFTGECDLEFVMEEATPGTNGLTGGQFTLDELFVQWSRKERFTIALGRLQTRFVLRGGVFPKSLDRNDSNNVNVTWTDGLHAVYRPQNGWASNFILQRNVADGTGSIRRGLLDFDDGGARLTYFYGLENTRNWRGIAQRSFDVSYLPASLLKDGDPDGRRVDYWGMVGRFAARWPWRSEGPRLRAGMEIGYAPETPTKEASELPGSGDVSGLAWDIVLSAMDFAPNHSIGLNYGRTGAGWFLSPQFRPNEELIEIRYQWRPDRFPLLEARVRWREDLGQLVGAVRKRQAFDFYLRLTWQFTAKAY